mmetsp:Transcript_8392/g.18281  ORF Transcript_8392/g.18281 Transcript_8392/m.18281 type:complete len:248 (-) Transcript_8392:438-1181(-)|eukprot:5207340-Pleurochrysis_carterae.AAC.1
MLYSAALCLLLGCVQVQASARQLHGLQMFKATARPLSFRQPSDYPRLSQSPKGFCKPSSLSVSKAEKRDNSATDGNDIFLIFLPLVILTCAFVAFPDESALLVSFPTVLWLRKSAGSNDAEVDILFAVAVASTAACLQHLFASDSPRLFTCIGGLTFGAFSVFALRFSLRAADLANTALSTASASQRASLDSTVRSPPVKTPEDDPMVKARRRALSERKSWDARLQWRERRKRAKGSKNGEGTDSRQ